VAAAAMRFDAAPVINTLEDMLAIFVDLQLDHRQPAVVTQRQQIDWPRAAGSISRTMRGTKLRMQRRNNQTGIKS